MTVLEREIRTSIQADNIDTFAGVKSHPKPEITPALDTDPSSIFTYYNVANEVNFVKKELTHGATDSDMGEYLQDGVYKFLEEFVGKVKGTKINYLWRGGALHSPGVARSAKEAYEDWAQKSGDPRAAADLVGFSRMERSLQAGGNNTSFWVSPPSIGAAGFGTYGFLFICVNRDNKVEEHILRYEGEDATLHQSTSLFNYFTRLKSELEPVSTPDGLDAHTFGSEVDFLKNPISLQISEKELSRQLTNLGFDIDLQKRSQFLEKITSDMFSTKLVEDYKALVLQMSRARQGMEFDQLMNEAKERLSMLYIRSSDLKKRPIQTKTTQGLIDHLSSFDGFFEPRMYQSYKSRQDEAQVTGGGSCPAGKSQKESELMFDKNGVMNFKNADLLKSMGVEDGNDSKFHPDYKCPECKITLKGEKKDDKKSWLKECPECNAKLGC